MITTLRAMASLAAGISVGERVCSLCNDETSTVTWLQYEAFKETQTLRCMCGGLLLPKYDTRLRAILTAAAAESVDPDLQAGLDAIQARTRTASADAPAEADQTAPTT